MIRNRPIPFVVQTLAGREEEYLREVLASHRFGGNGPFTKKCVAAMRETLGCRHALLTHSCTAALEMMAILADLMPGDEVIMPSFTFVSTANAVALRGGVPVFVDIREDTLNIDETLIERAITGKTRAIMVVHYAGVCCDMDPILEMGRRHGLLVIEDAAQAYLSQYKGRPAGILGDMAAFSFHETKNVTSGEGGAFITNREDLMGRAEVIWEKGTNRSRFLRGEVDKYSWVDLGSSYLPSELVSGMLLAQLEAAEMITQRRTAIWERYHAAFVEAENSGRLRRPVVPPDCRHNGHLYYLLLATQDDRDRLMGFLKARGIGAPFHYVPLHSAPGGLRYGRTHGELRQTVELSGRLLRLPLHLALDDADIDCVISYVFEGLGTR